MAGPELFVIIEIDCIYCKYGDTVKPICFDNPLIEKIASVVVHRPFISKNWTAIGDKFLGFWRWS